MTFLANHLLAEYSPLNHDRLKETPNNKSSAVLWKLLKAMLYLIPLFNLTKLIGMMERQKYDYQFQLQCPNGKCYTDSRFFPYKISSIPSVKP